MATLGSLTDEEALTAIESISERTEMAQPISLGTGSVQSRSPARAPLDGRVYLFIYRVRHGYDAYAWVDNIRYCTVFALGKTFSDAERIAINCVHQHGWRILKTDTATAFAIDRFTDGGTDAAHVANLADFGVSFKLNH